MSGLLDAPVTIEVTDLQNVSAQVSNPPNVDLEVSNPSQIIAVTVDGLSAVEVQVPGQRGAPGPYPVSASVVSGHLIFTMSDGSTIDAGAFSADINAVHDNPLKIGTYKLFMQDDDPTSPAGGSFTVDTRTFWFSDN